MTLNKFCLFIAQDIPHILKNLLKVKSFYSMILLVQMALKKFNNLCEFLSLSLKGMW